MHPPPHGRQASGNHAAAEVASRGRRLTYRFRMPIALLPQCPSLFLSLIVPYSFPDTFPVRKRRDSRLSGPDVASYLALRARCGARTVQRPRNTLKISLFTGICIRRRVRTNPRTPPSTRADSRLVSESAFLCARRHAPERDISQHRARPGGVRRRWSMASRAWAQFRLPMKAVGSAKNDTRELVQPIDR